MTIVVTITILTIVTIIVISVNAIILIIVTTIPLNVSSIAPILLPKTNHLRSPSSLLSQINHWIVLDHHLFIISTNL